MGEQIAETLPRHRGLGGRALHERVIEPLRQVRISDPERRVHAYPHQLSGGIRQRVAGAIAISCQPSLLIADEPTTSLDVTIQAQYLRLLRLERPTGGRILIGDRDVHALGGAELRAYRRAVQPVFQDPYSSLNPRLPIRTIVGEPCARPSHTSARASP